jgi:hypothetical protein
MSLTTMSIKHVSSAQRIIPLDGPHQHIQPWWSMYQHRLRWHQLHLMIEFKPHDIRCWMHVVDRRRQPYHSQSWWLGKQGKCDDDVMEGEEVEEESAIQATLSEQLTTAIADFRD